MDITELATPNGAAIDLTEVGETIEGVLTHVGGVDDIWVPIDTKFGVKLKCPFNLKVGDDDRTLWVTKGSRLATVLMQAFKEAGLTAVATGGILKLRRVADVPTTKGNAMFDYAAKYIPPAGVGPELDDF